MANINKRLAKVEGLIESDLVNKEYLGGALYDYALKREHLALEASLQNYTLITQFVNYQAEQLVKEEQAQEHLSSNYFTKGVVSNMVDELEDRVRSTYVTEDLFLDFKEDNYMKHKKADEHFKKVEGMIRNLENDLKEQYVEIGQLLAKKTDNTETERILENLKLYALYQDLKDLYAKVMPPLAVFEEKMDMMAAGYEQSKEMIRRYDEVMSDKASKRAITEVYEAMKPFVKQDHLKRVQEGI